MNSRNISNLLDKSNHDFSSWLKSVLLTPVNLFQLYRFFLAIFLLALFFTRSGPSWLGSFSPSLFTLAAIIYLAFVIASLLMSQMRAISLYANTRLIMLSDIVFITLLMHASGGVQSGLGLLLAISIAAGGLMMKGRLAILYASLATVAVISQQFAAYLYSDHYASDFMHSAMLGIAYFTIALLSHTLSKHIQASEELASQRQQDLRNMAQLSEYIIGHMQEGVIAIDPNGEIRLMNRAARLLFALPDAKQITNINALCPALGQKIRPRSSPSHSKINSAFTIPLTESNSPAGDLKVTTRPLGTDKNEGTLIFLEDLTEVNQQAQQLKLASIGRLTASIAHEIRNPLGAISHAGQLLMESNRLDENDHRLTEIITNNATRMNMTIENVLKLSKRDSAEPIVVTLKPWLKDVRTKMLQSLSLEDKQIEINITPSSLESFFDPNQFEQVMATLASNAIHHFNQEPSLLRLSLIATDKGGKISLEFIDNGPGIADDQVDNIFEPFFTTQSTGTGLGLYIARELLESNNAKISYNHVKPTGSNFTVYLPNADDKDDLI